MDESIKREMRLVFSEGVENLILPLFEELRGDIKEMFNDVEKRLIRLDRKFDVAMERMDEHSLILKDHDSRLTNLENSSDSHG